MYTFFLLMNALFFGLICTYYVHEKSASIFHPLTYYLLFHGLVFVIRPIFVDLQDLDGIYALYRFVPTTDTELATLLIANLALIFFILGLSRFADRVSVKTHILANRVTPSRLHIQTLMIAVVVLMPLVLWSCYSMFGVATTFTDSGALFGMRRDAETYITIFTNSVGYLVDANVMGGILACYLMWVFRFKVFAALPLILYLAFRAYLGQARWPILLMSATAVLLYCYEKGRRWPTWSHVLYGSGLMFVFWRLGQFRSYLQDLIGGVRGTHVIIPRAFFDNMDYANLEFLQYQVSVVPSQTHTYNYFLDVLQVFTEPIPRLWWPGKPIGAPIQLYNLFDYGFPIGMTKSLPGEGWQGFGYIGVCAYCFLAGLCIGWLYFKCFSGRKSVFAIAIYATLLPLTIQFYRDGILLSVVKFSFFPLIAALTWYFLYSTLEYKPIFKERRVAPKASHHYLNAK